MEGQKFIIIQTYLDEKGVESMFWPPQSPDLNPIENAWGYLKTCYRKLPTIVRVVLAPPFWECEEN